MYSLNYTYSTYIYTYTVGIHISLSIENILTALDRSGTRPRPG